MEFNKFTGTMPPAAKAIFDDWRGPIPFSTFLQLLAYCYKRDAASFQYVNSKRDRHLTEAALVTANNTSVMKEMHAYFEEFEVILRQKGALIEEEDEE